MSKEHFKRFGRIAKEKGLAEALAFDAEETGKRAVKRVGNYNERSSLSAIRTMPNQLLAVASMVNYIPLAIKEGAKDLVYGTKRENKSQRMKRFYAGDYAQPTAGFLILPFLMVLLSLVFLAPSLTGYVAASSTNLTFNILGGFLFIFGLTATFFYVSGKKNSKR